MTEDEMVGWHLESRLPGEISTRSNQSILKETSPEYSLKGLMVKLNLQYFGQCKELTH